MGFSGHVLYPMLNRSSFLQYKDKKPDVHLVYKTRVFHPIPERKMMKRPGNIKPSGQTITPNSRYMKAYKKETCSICLQNILS